jgi:hypothetical protein
MRVLFHQVKSWVLLVALAVLFLAAPAQIHAEETVMNIQEGDVVCAEGFIMDYYCIELGFLLDDASAVTLRDPDRHSVHCLVDVPQCFQSEFEILIDPEEAGQLYSRGWRVDDTGRELLIDLARATGMREGESRRCSTCTTDDGNVEFGFRAAVLGTIMNIGDDDT